MFNSIEEILQNGTEMFQKAYEIAAEVHKDQKRKDGNPYMTHIDQVILRTAALGITPNQLALCVAALHDAVEDHPDKVSLESLQKELSSYAKTWVDVLQVVNAVAAISKKPKGTESYSNYVLRVKNNELARIVKLADLEHNMSDLKSGNMLDKYELTYWVLND